MARSSLRDNSAPEAAGPYPILERGPDGAPALVVQAGQWGKWLGWLDLEFDGRGRVANESCGKLFISIHANAARSAAHGTETYFLAPHRTYLPLVRGLLAGSTKG